MNKNGSGGTEVVPIPSVEDENKVRTVPTEPKSRTGSETTGVGQPELQAVQQGESLPPIAVPVEKTLVEKSTDHLYNPIKDEIVIHRKQEIVDGGKKTTDLDEEQL